MLIKATFDKDGYLQKIHPNPNEKCNLDDADDVRPLTIGQLYDALSIYIWDKAEDVDDDKLALFIDNELVCWNEVRN